MKKVWYYLGVMDYEYCITGDHFTFASFGELFGGAVFAQQVFSYPGLGGATVEAGFRGDIPLLFG